MPELRLANEAWMQVAGSYEDTLRQVRQAAQNSNQFGSTQYEWDVDVEATMDTTVIVVNTSGAERTYYRAGWSKDDDGNIVFDDVEEVQLHAVVKAKNEQVMLMEAIREKTETKPLLETMRFDLTLNEETGRYTGSVDVAQRADTKNHNRRFYPKDLLREAQEAVQERIEQFGPLLMDSYHRTKVDGKGNEVNATEPRETVAVLHSTSWDEANGTIGLDELEIVDTAAGKDIKALVDAGVQFQVSQRGYGKSQLVQDGDTQELSERVTSLTIETWDFVPPGTASVEEASVSLKESDQMAEHEEVLTAEQTQQAISEAIETLKGELIELQEAREQEQQAVLEDTDDAGGDEAASEPEEDTPLTEAAIAARIEELQLLEQQLKEDKTRLSEAEATIAQFSRDQKLRALRETATRTITELLATDDYARFSTEHKAIITEAMNVETLHDTIEDPSDSEAVKTALQTQFDAEIAKIDRVLANSQLAEMGWPNVGEGLPVRHVRVINEAVPARAHIQKLMEMATPMVESQDDIEDWQVPKGHAAEKILDKVMQEFYESHWAELTMLERCLNEAGEGVTQSDIGGRIASISAAVVPLAWRRITAFQICNLGTMDRVIEDIKVPTWLPAETSDIVTDVTRMMVTEGGNVPESGITYANFPLYATRKALNTSLTPEAIAAAKNTPMQAQADAIAGLAISVRQQMDRMLWYLHLIKSWTYSVTEVSTFASMTDLGSNVWSFGTGIAGIVQAEYVKTVDANGNPTGAKPCVLYGGTLDANITLEPLAVQEEGGDNTDLVYGTDYSVQWEKGTITLTASGVTKEATNGLHAKYTYTGNSQYWSVTPASGVQLYWHLMNLRQIVGEAKNTINTRHWTPNYIAMNTRIEELITNGANFTQGAANPADVSNALDNVVNFKGLEPIKSTAIPPAWMLVGQRGACTHKVHTPWTLEGPIINPDTHKRVYVANQFTGEDVPVPAMLTTVGIQDLSTAVS